MIRVPPARGPSIMGSEEIDMPTTTGTIKRLVHDKGFGFIAASDGNEYFFHQSRCQTPSTNCAKGGR